MFIIIEFNGGLDADSIMGLVLDKEGKTKTWDSETKALRWAKRNCAFNYKIVNLC